MELAKNPTGEHVFRNMIIGGHRVRIDVNIFDLVKGLNRLGIVTINSCGGSCMGWCERKHRTVRKKTGKREAYREYHKPKACRESFTIVFANPAMAAQFMNVVFKDSDPEKLRDHMQGFGLKQSHAWTWGHYLDNFGTSGQSRFDFWSVVVIPHAHLELVTQRVLARCKELNV